MKRSVRAIAALGVATVALGLILMTATSVAAGSLPTLTLAVSKNAITVGGSKVSGAVQIVTTVSGEKSDNPGLILLKPGVTVGQFAKVVAKLGNGPLDAIDPYGTIQFDSQDAVQGVKTVTQAVLPPGTYVALNNGNGHAVFTVTKSSAPASLPKPAATITAIDFAFRGASTLRDGQLVRFENDGYLVHMVLYAQAKSAADAKKAEALLLLGKTKEAGAKYGTGLQGTFAGPLSHGVLQQEVVTQPPGYYVIFCAMPAQDGRAHFQLGMERTIHIVK
jgi:hypothetical protein